MTGLARNETNKISGKIFLWTRLPENLSHQLTVCNEMTYFLMKKDMRKVCQNMTFRSGIWQYYDIDFEIMFKCMSGATTEDGKFIMPLKEKLSYNDSSHRCNSAGFAINLNLIEIWIQGKNVLAQQKIAWTNSRESFQDSDYKFNFLKTRMSKNSWTLLLLITQTGSEFNFKIMKSGAMMNFGVSLNNYLGNFGNITFSPINYRL